jgi:hypothetical protein
MARSSRTVRKIFLEQGFKVGAVPNETFVEHYPSLAAALVRKTEFVESRPATRLFFRIMHWQVRLCNVVCMRIQTLDRIFGHLFTVLFTMVPHRFRAVKIGGE